MTNRERRLIERIQYIEIIEKLASLCFGLFDKAHERHKHCALLVTPIDTILCFILAFIFFMCTSALAYMILAGYYIFACNWQ